MEFIEKEVYTLGAGEVRFAALKAPYSGNPEYTPKYSIALAYTKQDKESYEMVLALFKLLGGKSGVKIETGEDGITPTGTLVVGFNSSNPFYVVDSEGVQIPLDKLPMIGRGSKARVQFHIYRTARGRFKDATGVQLLEVVAPVLQPRTVSVTFDKVEGASFKAPALPTMDEETPFSN